MKLIKNNLAALFEPDDDVPMISMLDILSQRYRVYELFIRNGLTRFMLTDEALSIRERANLCREIEIPELFK